MTKIIGNVWNESETLKKNITRKMVFKILTNEGSDRKVRITKKSLHKHSKILFFINMYIEILPNL